MQATTPLKTGNTFLAYLLRANNTEIRATLLAEILINKFSSLIGVLCADFDDLATTGNIGPENASVIKVAHSAILEVASSATMTKVRPDHMTLINLVIWTIGECEVEKLLIIYLNQLGGVKGHEILCIGSERCTGTSSNLVVRAALRRGAAAFMVAHNHPNGSVDPSEEDLILTRQIAQKAESMGLRLADHVIVAGSDWFSFRKHGYCP